MRRNCQRAFEIREYQPSDSRIIEQLILELQLHEHAIESDRVIEPGFPSFYLKSLLDHKEKDSGEIFVAECEGDVVGFVCVWIVGESDNLNSRIRQYGYIPDLIVREKFRSSGAGKALIQKAEMYLQSKDVRYSKVRVLSKNDKALTMCATEGYRRYEEILMKDLFGSDELLDL